MSAAIDSAPAITAGYTVELERVFAQADFDDFAALTGDDNPIHVDPVFAATTRFGKTLCHGMLLFSTIAEVIRSKLPGVQTELLEQDLMFPGPAFTKERLRVRVEVIEVDDQAQTATLETSIIRPDGDLSCTGRAKVRWVAVTA